MSEHLRTGVSSALAAAVMMQHQTSNSTNSSSSSSHHHHRASTASLNNTNFEMELRFLRFRATQLTVSHLTRFYIHVLRMHIDRESESGRQQRITFMYHGEKVGIRFEYEKLNHGGGSNGATRPSTTIAKQETKLRDEDDTNEGTNDGLDSNTSTRPPSATPTTSTSITAPSAITYPLIPSTSTSLVIYVIDLLDYISRARENGFVVFLDTTVVCEQPLIRSAVLLDPQGMRVRLMESDVFSMAKVRARGRIAYVSVEVKEYQVMEKCMQFYEEVALPKSQQNKESASGNSGNNNSSNNNNGESTSKTDLQSVSSYLSTPRATGFRLVDMERFVPELTTYLWFSNGSRKKNTALCLIQKVKRKRVEEGRVVRGRRKGWEEGVVMEDSESSDDDDGSDDGDASGSDDDEDGEGMRRASMRARMAVIQQRIEASEPEDSKLFLGLSFSVADIDATIAHLAHADLGIHNQPINMNRSETRQGENGNGNTNVRLSSPSSSPSSRIEVQYHPGFPRFISLVDPTSMLLELTDGVLGMTSSSSNGSGGSGGSTSRNFGREIVASYAQSMLNTAEKRRQEGGKPTTLASLLSTNSRLSSPAAAPSATSGGGSFQPRPPSSPFIPSSPRKSPTAANDSDSDDETGGGAFTPSRAKQRAAGGYVSGESSVSVSSDDDDAGVGVGANVQNALSAQHAYGNMNYVRRG